MNAASTFSSTVIWPNNSVFWNVRAMPSRASASLGWPVMSLAEERNGAASVGV